MAALSSPTVGAVSEKDISAVDAQTTFEDGSTGEDTVPNFSFT